MCRRYAGSWEAERERWRLLTLAEQRTLWALRDR